MCRESFLALASDLPDEREERNQGQTRTIVKALDIPTKKDFEKISVKVASMDRSLSKLTGKKRAKVAPAKPMKKEVKVCKVKDCGLPVRAKGYCAKHYEAQRRGKVSKSKPTEAKCCKVNGCDKKLYAKGYCRNHYMKWWRGGLK